MKKSFRIASGLFACLLLPPLLAGCKEYADRRETVSFAAGNSVAYNRAVHTVDPWPSRSFDNRFSTQGATVHRPVTEYRNGPRPGAQPANPRSGTTQTGVR